VGQQLTIASLALPSFVIPRLPQMSSAAASKPLDPPIEPENRTRTDFSATGTMTLDPLTGQKTIT
jgi:hypothetical protein